MSISRLEIQHLRNLSQVKIEPSAQVNILSGLNGSGKTSVLEALHLLGLGRSFRTQHIRHLIQHQQSHCLVAAEIDPLGQGRPQRLGVQRQLDGDSLYRYAGNNIDLSTLAELVPLQVINADTFELLEGSPQARRQYIDWGSFHAERSFIQLWRGFRRVLKQRNTLLKCGKIDYRLRAVWDREFVRYAEQLTDQRARYIELLKPAFEAILARLLSGVSVEIGFRPGWDRKRPLDQHLAESFERDLRQGFTSYGPQRADLRVKADGYNAAERLSRGQKKLVVSALKLAQGSLFHQLSQRACIYLIDDLPSELDSHHSQTFCEYLAGANNQCFITCVDRRSLPQSWGAAVDTAHFVVEDGSVRRAD
ncbi:DNA replication/repair protein RecF [Marinobacterium arenosum]|uniref:DNA replication/repair protein RecF n=1 Tax=Marinobacterium arenosum TaxID=2862496 RepID=UPI001C94AAB1|nr:DNA replication/repair protein RecF [Marinobacterium arenosum]MBY4676580.1 DNA replication/repair protein RecF [Marinobacterium arenosum]